MPALPDDFLQSLDSRDESLLECLRDVLAWPGADALMLEDAFEALCEKNELGLTSKGVVSVPSSDFSESKQTPDDDVHCRLSRWLVSFDSGSGCYPVGEFLALKATAAIERAIEVFGPGCVAQAEEIPWDAAPLCKADRP